MSWLSVASLRVRLLLLVCLAVGPMVGLVLYTAAEERQLEAREAQEQALRLVQFVSDEHNQLLEGARQLLTGLAQIPDVRTLNAEACSAIFADVLKRFPIYANVGAVKPNGEIFCSGVPSRGLVNVADRPYFQRSLATRDFAVGEYVIGRITGKATIPMAYPAVDDAGHVQAVVFVGLDVSWLDQLVAKTRVPEGSTVLMLDGNGTILTRHPDPATWVGRSMPEAALVKAILTRRGEGTVETTGLDGVPRLYAFSPLRGVSGGGSVSVSIGIPTTVAFADVRRLLVRQLAWLGVVTGLALGAAWALGDRFILRRVQALVQATQRLTAGDLRARSGLPHGPGEFGHLAQAFDTMAEALQQAHDALEGRVQARTAELAQANAALRGEIAERRRIEERLAHSLALLQATLEATADGILVTDNAGNLMHANRKFAEMWRIPEAIIAAQDTAQLQACLRAQVTAPDGLQAPEPILSAPPDADSPAILDCTEGRVFECSAQPQRVGDTRVGTVWSFRDITQRRAAERLKDAFVSTVSHELRTPLSSMRGFAELLLTRTFSPEQQREFVTIMHRETLRLTQLINDFLDLQRIESGRQMYQMARVDLVLLLRETLTLFQVDDTHPLHLDVPEPLPLVDADADRIRQVLANLLSNAVKFSPQGGAVTFGARHEGAHVRIWVADHGVGIPPEALPHLFGKFFRVDHPETRGIGGTGLGLALVKEIVEVHHGRVWVESVYGQGSTVCFTLPVAAPLPPPMAAPEGVMEGGADILLVEDDYAFAQLLRAHFETTGLSITTTDRAERALELVRQAPPRALLVDLQLAGAMDGWDLLIALKSDPAWQALPVLIISVSAEANIRGLALGGADYLLKPVAQEELLGAIRRRLPSGAGKTVLVVDDDAAFRRQVGASLAAAGDVRVMEAANGQEALAHLVQHMPDLLVLDLLMPDIDGFEVLRQLRADKQAMNLPVLVVTGKDLSPREKASLKRNLASLVSKQEASLDYFARSVGHILDSQARSSKEI